MNEYLLRSFLYVPANNKRFIDKALQSNADALILDVEDSVPSNHKQTARDCIIEYCTQGKLKNKKVFVRINEMTSKDFALDTEQLIHEDITGYVIPKIYNKADIVFLDRFISIIEIKKGWPIGTIVLAPIIETAESVADVYGIAHASKRLIALLLGGEDYLNDLSGSFSHSGKELEYPRFVMANAARSARLLPIDTPYFKIDDIEGFIKKETEMFRMGYAGCALINPKQIDPAHICFSPQKADLEHARGVIEAVSEAKRNGTGVVMYNGAMIGPPMQKRAENVLKQAKLLECFGKTVNDNAE